MQTNPPIIDDLLQWIEQEKELFYSDCFVLNTLPLSNEQPISILPPSLPDQKPIAQTTHPVNIPPEIKEKKTEQVGVDPTFPFQQIKALIEKVEPNYPLQTTILDDREAKKAANKWKFHLEDTPLAILTYNPSPLHLPFFKRIKNALEVYFLPCSVHLSEHFEQAQAWDLLFSQKNLKLILISEEDFEKLSHLKSFYTHNPISHEHFFYKIPIFFLSKIDFYIDNPDQKKLLWEKLCLVIKNL